MEKFWAKVEKTGSCWVWLGRLNEDGYGSHDFKNTWKTTFAHRLAYGLLKGHVPPYPEFELDHLCKNRACVNPDHLEPVSHRVNVSRGRLGSVVAERNSSKTHCRNGHPYNEKNTYTDPKLYGAQHSPSRHCRICKVQAHKRWRLKKRKTHE